MWLAQVPVVMWSNDDVGDPWRFQGKDILPTKIQVSISEVFKNLSTCTVQAINLSLRHRSTLFSFLCTLDTLMNHGMVKRFCINQQEKATKTS